LVVVALVDQRDADGILAPESTRAAEAGEARADDHDVAAPLGSRRMFGVGCHTGKLAC
jgi:hypothetical protein